MKVECVECGAVMSERAWQTHHCPATPDPLPGESWEAYEKRAAAAAAAYRKGGSK